MENTTNECRSILIVDDDYGIRLSLKEIFEDEGYRVLLACNGREALDVLRKSPNVRPCAILLDLMMPVMDGARFRNEQINDPTISTIPVIVLTADGSAITKAAAMSVTMAFTKPLQLDELLESVAKYCPPVTNHPL